MTYLGLALLLPVLTALVYAAVVWARRPRLLPADDPEHVRIPKMPNGQFIEVDGFKIRFVQKGRGPDVVLVHGIGSSIITWWQNFEALAEHYRVTAFDLPGFGFSSKFTDRTYTLDEQADRSWKFLSALGIQKCFLVGHSMGGTIAAWMTKTEPQRVQKLALIAPALHPSVIAVPPWLGLVLGSVVKSFIVTPTLVEQIYLRMCVATPPSDLSAEIMYEFYRPFHRSPESVTTFLAHRYLLNDRRIPREMAALKVPLLVITGVEDRVVRPKNYEEFLRLNPKAETLALKATGHQVHEEKPAEVLARLRTFFDG